MIGLFLMAAAALSADGPAGPLPPYPVALRCAGLAEAAATIASRQSAQGRTYYDAGIFWGFATSEAARAAGISAERFTRDQEEAAAFAEKQLRSSLASARKELADCLAKVPPLEK